MIFVPVQSTILDSSTDHVQYLVDIRKFQASLDAIGWPTPIPHPSYIADEKQEDFDYAFKEYLLLQEP